MVVYILFEILTMQNIYKKLRVTSITTTLQKCGANSYAVISLCRKIIVTTNTCTGCKLLIADLLCYSKISTSINCVVMSKNKSKSLFSLDGHIDTFYSGQNLYNASCDQATSLSNHFYFSDATFIELGAYFLQ